MWDEIWGQFGIQERCGRVQQNKCTMFDCELSGSTHL